MQSGSNSARKAIERVDACNWAGHRRRLKILGASASETAKPGSLVDGQPRHCQAIFKARGRSLGLERLCAHRREQHRIQMERIAGGSRNGQMAQMRRVKASAEKGDTAPVVPRSQVSGAWRLSAFGRDSWLSSYSAGRAISVAGSGCRRLESDRSCSATALCDISFIILALAGIVVSALALKVHYSTGTEPCYINDHWDCGIVNHSSFAVIATASCSGHWDCRVSGAWSACACAPARLPLPRRTLGIALRLHLTMIEQYGLGVWCLYCVISQGIIALFSLLSIGWLIAAQIANRARRSEQASGVVHGSRLSSRAERGIFRVNLRAITLIKLNQIRC